MTNEFSNIESFYNNSEWKNIYATFQKYETSINLLSINFSIKYNFKENDIRNAFMYELMSFQYSSKKQNSFLSQKYFNYCLLYLSFMLFLLLFYPILFFADLFKNKQIFDVLYEEMWDKDSWYKRFYKYIDDKLKLKFKRAIFFTTMSLKKIYDSDKIDLWNGKVVDTRNNNRFFDSCTVLKILRKDFFYGLSLYKLSKKEKVNFILLYMLVLRRLLVYSSQITNVKSKVMVAAGDYYWNPLKYLCYKKNIENIILLQHNNKDNYLYGRLFPYCDYYYGHSEDGLSKLVGIDFAEKNSVGSFQLIPFLETKVKEFDILFINQPVYDNLKLGSPLLDQHKLIQEHAVLITNFKRYLQENPSINTIYISKPSYLKKEPAKSIEKDFKNIPNIEFFEAYGVEMFQYVSKSKLIINMYSSVGKEAYGLNVKVLWINYNSCCDIFECNTEIEDLHVIKDNNSYETFKERINLLLSANKEVDVHYKKLKEKFMNIQEDPSKIIAAKICHLIDGCNC